MTHTERAIDLLLYIQRFPRTFGEVALRYPNVSKQTLWRHRAELRQYARLRQDWGGRHTIPVHMLIDREERRAS